ncbi:Oidioi.mRNA.OKI2018_I69.chr1.g230.t1.cds [Oikopleura dioica]|uniref:Oidioi.mRNA.OKI2018_I69.chr1.g230.t1.cds n=1 Tax=Oikopleura dioica TaxID=34765 RepID=A0ABN7SQG0_OIKDI|nr:Oidioi.mRNA.OKI2018_I69.chr1.g230.t1.cds [Oikopleura dioica]
MKAYKNGMKKFTLKFGASDKHFYVGKSQFHYFDEKIKPVGDQKWRQFFSIAHEGRKLRFKARLQAMDAVAGFERKLYDWKETDSEGVLEQIIVLSNWPPGGQWYSRYHLIFLE